MRAVLSVHEHISLGSLSQTDSAERRAIGTGEDLCRLQSDGLVAFGAHAHGVVELLVRYSDVSPGALAAEHITTTPEIQQKINHKFYKKLS